MMEKLIGILTELRPDVDFENNDQLVDSGELDSFDIVMLIGEINNVFDIKIPIVSIIPENFNSVNSIMKLIENLKGQAN